MEALRDQWDQIQIEDEEGFEHHIPFPEPADDDVATRDSKKRKAVDEAPVEQAPAPKRGKTVPPVDPISGNADWVAYVDKSGEPLLSEFKQRLRSWAQVRAARTIFQFLFRLVRKRLAKVFLPLVQKFSRL